jgi:hypothetical protein
VADGTAVRLIPYRHHANHLAQANIMTSHVQPCAELMLDNQLCFVLYSTH